jgi:hypothetical protein
VRVTFDRLADHEWGQVLIERDDRVVYRMHAGPITGQLPHDLVHFTVEDTLALADGIWGAIAGGVVFRSMTHVSGRRPPHAQERSAALIRHYREHLQRAELLGGFVERAARLPDAELDRLAARTFSAGPRPDRAALVRAVGALRLAEERWQAVPVGEHLVLDWPGRRRIGPLPVRRAREGVGARRQR